MRVQATATGEEEHQRDAAVPPLLASDADTERASVGTLIVPPVDEVEELLEAILEPPSHRSAIQVATILPGAPIPPFCRNVWHPSPGGKSNVGVGSGEAPDVAGPNGGGEDVYVPMEGT